MAREHSRATAHFLRRTATDTEKAGSASEWRGDAQQTTEAG